MDASTRVYPCWSQLRDNNPAGLLLGFAAYLLFMVFSAPASWAVSFLQNRIPGLQLVATEGSLWSGRAKQLYFQGQTVTDPTWSWRPLALLLGRVEYRLQGIWLGEPSLSEGRCQSYRIHLSGRCICQSYVTNPVCRSAAGKCDVAGQMIMELEKVELSSQGMLPILYGQIRWLQAEVNSPMQLQLGNVLLELAPGDQKTNGKLTAEGGQLLIDGTLEFEPAGDYTLLADVRADGPLPPAVKNGLDTFAEFRDGQYRLDLSGNLLSLLGY